MTHPQYNSTCLHCGMAFHRPPSRVARGENRYCSKPCRSAGVKAKNARNLLARFHARVDTAGDCWEWIGGRTMAGYGLFSTTGNNHVLAHRFAYTLAYGPIPEGLLICHSCDNPPCCNPDHLWLGNDAVNAADMVAKGRSTKGDRHAFRQNPERAAHGENHVCAKLREVDVRAMRFRYAAGGVTFQELADAYGVTSGAISAVIMRKNWKHVR